MNYHDLADELDDFEEKHLVLRARCARQAQQIEILLADRERLDFLERDLKGTKWADICPWDLRPRDETGDYAAKFVGEGEGFGRVLTLREAIDEARGVKKEG